MGNNTPELTLLQRAVGGDPVAVTVLLTQAHSRLRTHIERRVPVDLRSTVEADDIIQEAQVEVFRHMQRFEPRGPESFYRWVATIALRRLRNAIKARRTVKRGGSKAERTSAVGVAEDSVIALLELMTSPEKTPSHTAARHEAALAIQAALEQLREIAADLGGKEKSKCGLPYQTCAPRGS